MDFVRRMDSANIHTQRDGPLGVGDLVLDRYRVDRRIAAGGHSIVYRGTDQRLSRPVCIKAFWKTAEKEGVRRTAYEHFVQEAFALSKLNHPNTLCIYDFGHVDFGHGEVPLQVSEFMSGGTLSQVIQGSGVFSLEETLDTSRKLADALAEAHQVGIIHRDIKPQNILFTARAGGHEPKIADFGIAKSLEPHLAHRAEDTRIVAGFPLVMYSPGWAAPEQLRGAVASATADIYSLALVTIYCLTGTSILVADTLKESYQYRRDIDIRIAWAFRNQKARTTLMDLLKRSCAFEPSKRPQSAEEFAEELTELIHSNRRYGIRPRAAMGSGTIAISKLDPQTASPIDQATTQLPPNETKHVVVPLGPESRPGSIGSRNCHFLKFASESLVLEVDRQRLRLTHVPGRNGPVIHIRGLSSFVAIAGGRPSVAVELVADGDIELIDPRQQVITKLRVSFGHPSGARRLFCLGGQSVSLDSAQCPDALMIDSSMSQQSYFLYSPPASFEAGFKRKPR